MMYSAIMRCSMAVKSIAVPASNPAPNITPSHTLNPDHSKACTTDTLSSQNADALIIKELSAHVVIIGSCPFSPLWSEPSDSSPCRPISSFSGTDKPSSRVLFSAQQRILTRLRIPAMVRLERLARMALLTRSAASCRKLGSRSAASGGSRESCGIIKSIIVFSRSSRNWGLAGARGPRCSVAKFNAGVTSPPGTLQVLMSSTS